jgi:hypothetical protein
MEALTLAELGDGASGGVGGADAWEGFEMAADQLQIELGPKGAEALLVDVDASFEEALLQAEDDDPSVEELFALDARDDADDSVVK